LGVVALTVLLKGDKVMNNTKNKSVAVVATSTGYVPATYGLGLGNVVPSSAFKPCPATGGMAVVLSGLRQTPSGHGLVVLASDPAHPGHGVELTALYGGFVGGKGAPASVSFVGAVKEAVSSGSPVYLAVAGNSRNFFCALSSEPFGAVAPEAPSAVDPIFDF